MDEEVASAAIIIGFVLKKLKNRRNNRRKWTKAWQLQRAVHGTSDAPLQVLRFTEEKHHINYLRMTGEDFDEIKESQRIT